MGYWSGFYNVLTSSLRELSPYNQDSIYHMEGGTIDMASNQDGNLPKIIVNELERCSDQQLEAIIQSAQHRLKERHGSTTEIAPRHDNETIISREEKGDYTLVIVEQTMSEIQTAYHVTQASDPESEERAYHWRYLGPVNQ